MRPRRRDGNRSATPARLRIATYDVHRGMGGATSFRTVQRTALKDLSPIPAGLFVLGQTDTYRGALSIVNQREAFRPPLEETPDPRSRFAAIALIGVV